MQLSFTPDMEKFIEEKVRSGQYADPESVVYDAVARLKSEEACSAGDLLDEHDLAELAEADREVERGEVLDWTDVSKELSKEFLGES